MSERDRDLAGLVAGVDGVVTDEELGALGIDRFARHRRTAGGLLVVEHPGVYRHAAVAPTDRGRVRAAVHAVSSSGLAGASGPAAMRLYDVRGVWGDDVEVTVRAAAHRALTGVRIRRIDHLDVRDVHRRHGIPVLAPPLALLLLGASVPPWKVETAVHDMVFQGLTAWSRLIDVLQRYGGRGRRGTAAFRAAVASLDADGRATQTNLELRLLRLVRDHGLPEPVLQHRVVDADGRRRRLDLAWPDSMLDVETDGDRDHLVAAGQRRDRVRDAALRALGWDIRRFTSADIDLRPAEVIGSLAEALRRAQRASQRTGVA